MALFLANHSRRLIPRPHLSMIHLNFSNQHHPQHFILAAIAFTVLFLGNIAGASEPATVHNATAATVSEPAPAAVEVPSAAVPHEIARNQREAFKSEISATSRRLGSWIDATAEDSGRAWLVKRDPRGISAARYLASIILLALVALFALTMTRLIRHKAGEIRGDDIASKSWPKLVLTAARKPLSLALILYGTYFALNILLAAVTDTGTAARLPLLLSWITYIGVSIAVLWLAFRIIDAIQRKMQAWADKSSSIFQKIVIPMFGTAARSVVIIIALLIARGAIDLSPTWDRVASKLTAMLVIACLARLLIRITTTTEKVLLRENSLDVADNLRARQIYTQVSVTRRIIIISVNLLAMAAGLMLFEPVRQYGASILASAGIAGVVLGLAAQKTLSNLFAGIQIAICQPIRIDDVVVVEGEWGRIEDISLTFVTVRIWDLRRLVLPITYFIEKPFQNWTRSSAKVINTVFLHADYTLPVEPLRQELTRLVSANPLWDGDVCVLQVTDSTPRSMEIRCIMSTADSSRGWDLKCETREGMVAYLQTTHPDCLPRVRADLRRDHTVPDSHKTPPTFPAPAPAPGTSSPGLQATSNDVG
jgi:small-conductance mechanosensitive channel